jgi:hypothetical protein
MFLVAASSEDGEETNEQCDLPSTIIVVLSQRTIVLLNIEYRGVITADIGPDELWVAWWLSRQC